MPPKRGQKAQIRPFYDHATRAPRVTEKRAECMVVPSTRKVVDLTHLTCVSLALARTPSHVDAATTHPEKSGRHGGHFENACNSGHIARMQRVQHKGVDYHYAT